jgi:hypothetical protein
VSLSLQAPGAALLQLTFIVDLKQKMQRKI